jgi:hypothetical protein
VLGNSQAITDSLKKVEAVRNRVAGSEGRFECQAGMADEALRQALTYWVKALG